jgi:hypothetical protein
MHFEKKERTEKVLGENSNEYGMKSVSKVPDEASCPQSRGSASISASGFNLVAARAKPQGCLPIPLFTLLYATHLPQLSCVPDPQRNDINPFHNNGFINIIQ